MFVFLFAWPFAASFYGSLCRFDLIHPPEFICLENCHRLASEINSQQGFGLALTNTFDCSLIPLSLSVITGVLLATRLSAKVRGPAIYKDQRYGLCNGLDIHALDYNKTILQQYGLQPPQTISDLDEIANALAPFDPTDWGCTSMDGQRCRHYGSDNLAAFRKGDQSLPGKTFPLLSLEDQEMSGRFTVILDGQWRVRNLAAFTENREARGVASPEFGVCHCQFLFQVLRVKMPDG